MNVGLGLQWTSRQTSDGGGEQRLIHADFVFCEGSFTKLFIIQDTTTALDAAAGEAIAGQQLMRVSNAHIQDNSSEKKLDDLPEIECTDKTKVDTSYEQPAIFSRAPDNRLTAFGRDVSFPAQLLLTHQPIKQTFCLISSVKFCKSKYFYSITAPP